MASDEQVLANIRDVIVQVMHLTYTDLVRLAENRDIWNSKPAYDIKSPWQGSNMQGMFTSIYDIPGERPPFNEAAFKELIAQYDMDLRWEIVFPKYDRAYRAALEAVNGYRRQNGLPEYPSVEDATALPLK